MASYPYSCCPAARFVFVVAVATSDREQLNYCGRNSDVPVLLLYFSYVLSFLPGPPTESSRLPRQSPHRRRLPSNRPRPLPPRPPLPSRRNTTTRWQRQRRPMGVAGATTVTTTTTTKTIYLKTRPSSERGGGNTCAGGRKRNVACSDSRRHRCSSRQAWSGAPRTLRAREAVAARAAVGSLLPGNLAVSLLQDLPRPWEPHRLKTRETAPVTVR